MDPMYKEALRKHRLYLTNELLVDDTIVQHLFQEGVLTESHVEEIQAQVTSRKKTLRLLDILPYRGPRAFGVFLTSLENEFPWVREKLEQDTEVGSACAHISTDKRSISESSLQTVPTDLQLCQLAARLGPEWQQVLLDLGLSSSDVYHCQVGHPYNLQSQVLAGLVRWKQRLGRQATIQRLLKSLNAAEIHPSTLQDLFQ